MNYKTLGNTGIKISEFALGCWQLAGDLTWGEQEEKDSLAAIQAALDHGINLFDNAAMYSDGEAEIILGKALLG